MKAFLVHILIPLAVGGLAGLLTMNSMAVYGTVTKPPLAPPAWVFPVAWSILYILMGIAAFLVWKSNAAPQEKKKALWLYGIQLAVNFLWPILFFNFHAFFAAFVWLVILLILVAITMVAFGKITKAAAWLLVPYVLWLFFAAYLNIGVYLLNR